MELLRQLDHPNVVKYVESFTMRATAPNSTAQNSLYIVMELVPPPPFPRTNRTSLVPPLVLSGHAASLNIQTFPL